jgi:quercetin dioxygenase-like cupin family protein
MTDSDKSARKRIAFFSVKDAAELGPETKSREGMDSGVLGSLSKLADLKVRPGLGEMSVLLFKAPGDPATGGGMSLVYLWFKSGYVLPPHSHNGDCLYYVIGGELRIGAQLLGKGDGMFVPAGTAYSYEAGPEGVEVLEFRNATQFSIQLKGNEGGRWDRVVAAFRARAAIWETESVPPSERTGK